MVMGGGCNETILGVNYSLRCDCYCYNNCYKDGCHNCYNIYNIYNCYKDVIKMVDLSVLISCGDMASRV